MKDGLLVQRLEAEISESLLSPEERADLITAALTGRPILIIGPGGSLKDLVASAVVRALGLPCQTVCCSPNIRKEDFFGDVDPLALRKFGYGDERSYVPGILAKANGGVLFLKDLDNLPPKLAGMLADFMDEGVISVGQIEARVDVMVVATSTKCELDERLQDRFQVVRMSYPQNEEEEQRFIEGHCSVSHSPPLYVPRLASRFLKRSRSHADLESGASTRSGIRFVENVCACMELSDREPDADDLRNSCYASFAHSIKPNPFSWKTNKELAKSIFEDAVVSLRISQKGRGGWGRLMKAANLRIVAAIGLVLVVFAALFVAMKAGAPAPPSFLEPDEGGGGLQPYTSPNLPEGGTELPKVDDSVLQEIEDALGPTYDAEDVRTVYDSEKDTLYVKLGNQTWFVSNYTERLYGGGGDESQPSGQGSGLPHAGIQPFLLVLSFILVVVLSTFALDRLGVGASIRDSRLMVSLRRRLGISWEPLTRLYRNIAEEVSPLSQTLEGDALGKTIKEISSARDELYAERAKDRASLSDIADLVKSKPERYPELSRLVSGPDRAGGLRPENQLIEDLRKHLLREGLIKGEKEVSFTHRVSKFLVSDVDERILKRVCDALQGVEYQELPPLPSSDIKDVRKYRRGDSYKDIAVRETIRDTVRTGRLSVGRDNLCVYEREPEMRQLIMRGDADVVVVLDLSGSMAYGEKLWYAKQAIVVMTIIAERYGNRVGVVGFRDLSTEVSELGAERNLTIAKVANLLPRGGTNLAAGIRRAIDLLVGEERARKGEPIDGSIEGDRRKQMILLTDGDATHPKPKQFASEYARRCARLASRYGISISVVCIGSDDEESNGGHSYNPELAAQIAEIGGGSLFFVKDMRDLSPVFVAEVDKLMIASDPLATAPSV